MGANARITVDLVHQEIIRPDGEKIKFEIDPLRRQLLLEGLDDIGQTMQHVESIRNFEKNRKEKQPWFPEIIIDEHNI